MGSQHLMLGSPTFDDMVLLGLKRGVGGITPHSGRRLENFLIDKGTPYDFFRFSEKTEKTHKGGPLCFFSEKILPPPFGNPSYAIGANVYTKRSININTSIVWKFSVTVYT